MIQDGGALMKYGKIRIEDGYLIFTKHMMTNNLPCKDILWAYLRREGVNDGSDCLLYTSDAADEL